MSATISNGLNDRQRAFVAAYLIMVSMPRRLQWRLGKCNSYSAFGVQGNSHLKILK
jgi:hypothetical protein